ncbi:MAG TPA: hypothetical protein VJ486_08435 [Geothrix sp.]|nr:hypothetical protein [Geothrix sp.]
MLMLPLLFMLLQTPAPQAAKAPEPVPPARIELTTPFPVNLGSVGPRESREAVFGIRSIHDRPFHFRVLDLSLGLSLDEAQLKEPMQPGEVRLIRVKVDATGLLGYIKGAVRLGTDDPTQPNYILRYEMVVRPEVSVDEARKSFGEVAPWESPEVAFHFKREGGDPLKLVLASELPPYLEPELVDQGTNVDFHLKMRPSKLKPGVNAGLEVIKVATNGPKQPLFDLYLDWRLVLPVVPTPARLVFSDLSTTLDALTLTARNGKPFRIVKLEIEGKGFQLLDRPTDEASRHVLRVRRTGKNSEALLVVHCSNMETPLKVPLRFLDPRARPKVITPPKVEIEEDHHHH